MIETTALTKRYGGLLALDAVSLKVAEGSVVGLVGPNGAGKTTLLRLLAGLRRRTSGEMHIGAPPARVAVLPDTPRFDSWLTGREAVELAQQLSDPTGSTARIEQVLGEAGLADAADRRVGGYSRGMVQRLGIACTLVASPSLVMLDEPAATLDPEGRREVLDAIRRLRGTSTVLFSSHILADVQEVCDSVAVLAKGRLLFQGTLAELLVGQAVPRYVVGLRSPLEPVIDALRAYDWVVRTEPVAPVVLRVEVRSLADAEASLPRALADAGANVVWLGPEEVSLERAFLEITR